MFIELFSIVPTFPRASCFDTVVDAIVDDHLLVHWYAVPPDKTHMRQIVLRQTEYLIFVLALTPRLFP